MSALTSTQTMPAKRQWKTQPSVFVAEGREVKIAKPIAGKDMNDALRECAHGE
jgi:hypothetical protein